MTAPQVLLVIGAVIMSGGLLLVIAELGCRLALKLRSDYWVLTPFRRTRMTIDKETLPALEDSVRFDVNADGERGDDPPADWADTYRVLVAGGSAAECYLLDQESSWPYGIQRLLNEPEALRRIGARRAHVGNISRSLVACEYISEMFRRVLPRYERLDLVLLMVGASDVVNWLEQKTPPQLAKGRLSAAQIFAEQPEGPWRWNATHNALRRVIARWNRRLRRPVEVRSKAGSTIAKNRRMRANAEELLDEIPDPAPMLEYFETYFRKLIHSAKAKGARIIVVRQPWFEKDHTPEEAAVLWNFGAGRPYVEEVKTYFTHRVVSDLMRRVDECAVRVCEEERAEHVDLMPVLERSLTTYYDFLHFTPTGAAAVARTVAEAILGEVPNAPTKPDSSPRPASLPGGSASVGPAHRRS